MPPRRSQCSPRRSQRSGRSNRPAADREASTPRIILRLGRNSAPNDDIDNDEETQLNDTQEDEVGQPSMELGTQNYPQSTQMDELDSESAAKPISQVRLVISIEALVGKN